MKQPPADVNEYDVIVAGGGPAGSVAALTLARSGLRVLLVHAADPNEFHLGEGLPPQALNLLAELGILERTLADGHRPTYGTLSAWGSADLRAQDFVFHIQSHGLLLDRARFDSMLHHLAQEAGVKVRRKTRLRIAPEKCRQTQRFRRVDLVGEDGASTVRCRWLIDATGRAATLSHLFGATSLRHDALAAFHLRLAKQEEGRDTEASTLVEAVDEGWWYTVLLPSGERLLVFLSDADLIDRRTLLNTEGFLDRLNKTKHVRQRAALHGGKPLGISRGASACSSRLEPMQGDHWIAVGDAALAFDPLSSKGISNAMYTGRCGAQAILAAEDGDSRACSRLQQHFEKIFTVYQAQLRQYYALEHRWPDSPFWRRRAPPPEISTFHA